MIQKAENPEPEKADAPVVPPNQPSIERRRLAAELRSLREVTGMTIEEARISLGWSSGRLNHMEGGRHSVPDTSGLRALLQLYEVTDPARCEALEALRQEAKARPWWRDFDDVITDGFLGWEERARRIFAFHPIVVPGLLQTPEYAAASARASLARTEDEIERIVAARVQRQERVLGRSDAPEFRCVLDESVLLRLAAMPAPLANRQLRHLVDVATAINTVSLLVLPIAVGLHGCLHGSTVLLEYDDERDPPIVYLETRSRGTYVTGPAQVADYRLALDDVTADALSKSASVDLIKSMITD
ncbi:helix-turn-helix domain-containing protein [Nocardiopsis sp. LOL_012]|uniref:helix-turn-helix domain-containing protein n=1 Tax=Nocardiopsis sp. LOL_012 TaxID=3345409 RepID=UPI003A86399C